MITIHLKETNILLQRNGRNLMRNLLLQRQPPDQEMSQSDLSLEEDQLYMSIKKLMC